MGEENRPHVEITTAIGCPIQCKYCPQNTLLKAYQGERCMTLQNFIRMVDKIPANVDIHFSGMCEPFINANAVEMVKYAAKNHTVSIFTTLTGLTKALYDEIKDIKYRWFCIHLPDGQLNTRLKATPEYMDLLEYVLNNKPKCVNFWFSMHGDHHPIVLRLTTPYIHEGYVFENTMIDRAGNLNLPWTKDEYEGNTKCSCGNFNQNVLLPNGDMILCCMDYGLKHKILNLLNEDYTDVRQTHYDLCKKCNRGVI